MPLISCPDCETEVSDQAPTCPKCGRAFSAPGGINFRDPVHLIGVGLAGIIILGMLMAMWGAIM